MGSVDLTNDTAHLAFVSSRLKRRGLILDTEEEWEIHGPPIRIWITS